jgi:alanyl aminopeptidase
MIRVARGWMVVVLALGCGGAPGNPITAIAPADGPPPRAESGSREQPLAETTAPLGRLPGDVRPTAYALQLEIVPERDGFTGVTTIDVELTRARSVIWLHGKSLEVREATVTPEGGQPIPARFEQVDDEGVASLRPERALDAGRATIRISYTARFDRQLKGLYRVDAGGDHYAFTQFEAISARLAFPSFDEPAFKTPFDVTLTVKREHVAIANTLVEREEEIGGGMKRIRYARTEALPTYLVAWAVGPLDVVEAPAIPPNEVRTRPLPFRGVAARGRGPELAYALSETPRQVAELERYFGVEYPYDKLDIIAVPDFAAGAMENAGAVTFREWLLLMDAEAAPEEQRRAFAGVMAHELAHMWFGNLVTMPWWNDIWLNEAFATWMSYKVVAAIHPEYHPEVAQMESTLRAMGSDSLATARRIRQPIDTNHDIRNAFDSITYSKGGGVLSMFERWVGENAFREGLRIYVRRHRFGSATADDLLRALSEAAERDVATPFRTFLDQAGVPLIEVSVECDGTDPQQATLRMRQQRYLPVGSEGERAQVWQIPFCVRTTGGEACTLLTEAEGTMTVPRTACTEWVMPNRGGAGYYRVALAAEATQRLMRPQVWSTLEARERLAIADSVGAAFGSASIAAADAFRALEPMARDPERAVATAPMGLVGFAREHLVAPAQRPAVEAYGRRLYGAVGRRLGWTTRPGEDGETKLLREEVIDFLAMTARDPAVRREAARRGRAYLGQDALDPGAVSPELAPVALAVAMEEGDAALFDRMAARFAATEDARIRGQLLDAMGHARDPALAERARMMALDPRLRVNEVMTPINAQMGTPETREAAWAWVRANFEGLEQRVASTRAGGMPWMAAQFCDEPHLREAQEFFGPRIERLPGGPRNLAGATEAIRLCIARVNAHRESAAQFFSARR